MFARARASLYQFAARVAYEPLDANFVAHVGRRFAEATKRKLDDERGLQVFRLLGNQPEAFLSVVQVPLARADRTLDDGLESLLAPIGPTPWTQYWEQSTLLQKAILIATESELQLTSEAGLQRISQLIGQSTVNHSSVLRALGAIRGRGVKPGRPALELVEQRKERGFRIAERVVRLLERGGEHNAGGRRLDDLGGRGDRLLERGEQFHRRFLPGRSLRGTGHYYN